MTERPSRVYWVQKNNGHHLLIFDRGHEGGSVHVYEFKESFEVDRVKEELRRYYNHANPQAAKIDKVDSVALWVEKKFGFPTTFELKD